MQHSVLCAEYLAFKIAFAFAFPKHNINHRQLYNIVAKRINGLSHSMARANLNNLNKCKELITNTGNSWMTLFQSACSV